MSPISRPSGRAPDALRALSFTRRFTKHAEGSVLVTMGDTRVLCTDSVLDKLPPHKKGSGEGWVRPIRHAAAFHHTGSDAKPRAASSPDAPR